MIPAIPSISSAIAAGFVAGRISGIGRRLASGTGAAEAAIGHVVELLLRRARQRHRLARLVAAGRHQPLAPGGDSGNASIADVTVASTNADLETQLVTAVRDKAVTAFNSIMDMSA